jgi:uncharacterized membrane protein YkoI
MFSPMYSGAALATMLLGASVAAGVTKGVVAKPMREVAAALEEAGYGPIVDLSMDDGVWEAEAYRDGKALELTVDPQTAEVLTEHRDDAEQKPPQDAKPLSELLSALEEAGFNDVTEASFERRYWEVEASQGADRLELHVDPRTAEVVSQRADD